MNINMLNRDRPYRIILTFVILLFVSISCSRKQDAHPILVLATLSDFGIYTGEILKTEGFNDFKMDSLSNPIVTLDYLRDFDIVILTENSVTPDLQDVLTQYVSEGGNLLAFRPDKKLSAVFGIVDTTGEISEAYLSINTNTNIGKGLTTKTLQFHGSADHYKLKSGREIARLFANDSLATEFPAIVMNDFGKGHAMAFLYNLPKSIVYARQGNYRHAGQEMDGITGIRAMDLFTNGFVNTSKNTLNQADEQMSLLTHAIEQLSLSMKPIPRFWYFPDTLKCMVTLNNDGEDSKEVEFGPQFEDVNAKGAKMTLYIKEVEYISKALVDNWKKKGFEISGHPDDSRQAVNPDWNTMDSVYKALLHELKNSYGITGMQTVTNHWFVWVGENEDGKLNFAAQAKLEEKNGVELDCNYAHYDNGSNQGHYLGEMGMNQGNYTGSGLSMKFADANGEIINVYQQLNNVYDQQYMEHKDQDGYYNAFKGLMDRSLSAEVYSTISVRAHNNEYFFSKIPLMKMLDYANDKGIPVWTELQYLEFLKAKDEATFSDILWSDNWLTFSIHSSLKHRSGITCLVPYTFQKKKVNRITSNGAEQSFIVKSIKGFDYAWITVKPGFTYSMKINYSDN